MNEHFYAVILAGGGGTRLWPKSRKKTPKHLLKLYGKKTMVQQAFDRILALIPVERIYLITLESYINDIKDQIPELLDENIIAEPQGKNTALAMGYASTVIRKRDPQAVLINLAADQLIEDEEGFKQTILQGLEVASMGNHIATIGIKPTFAHTGFGYIKTGTELKEYATGALPVFRGDGFKEKPDLETAQKFLDSGQYLWNANLYCWTVDSIAKAIEKYAPMLHQDLEKIFVSLGTTDEEKIISNVYETSENVQIDVAVSEKIANLAVIPGDFGWNDVGDWKVIYNTKPKDENGNVVDDEDGLLINISSTDCLVEGTQKLIAIVGLKDIVVVDTPDAILICHKDKTQDVKKVIEKLKEEKLEEYL